MKIFISALIFMFFISGCTQNEKKIEVVPNLDAVYLPASDVDVPAEGGKNFDSVIVNDLTNAVKSLKYASANLTTDFPIDIRLYINEKGKIDKLKNLSPNYSEIRIPDSIKIYPDRGKLDQAIASAVADWRFTPAIKNKVSVKYRTDISLRIFKSPSGNYRHSGLVYSNGDGKFYVAVDQMPEPIGGIKAIQERIKYPEEAKSSGIEGKVYVMAFIDENGNVVKAKILRGIGGGCDRAALNAVKDTKFIPGRQRGKAIKVKVAVPIVFKLK